MTRWNLADLPWDSFRRDLVDPRLLAIIKAAALVEHNSASYGEHLAQVVLPTAIRIAVRLHIHIMKIIPPLFLKQTEGEVG